jgi:hypothetical protein
VTYINTLKSFQEMSIIIAVIQVRKLQNVYTSFSFLFTSTGTSEPMHPSRVNFIFNEAAAVWSACLTTSLGLNVVDSSFIVPEMMKVETNLYLCCMLSLVTMTNAMSAYKGRNKSNVCRITVASTKASEAVNSG